MSSSERWSALDIDAPELGGLTPPGSEVHVLAMVAAPGPHSEEWAARAAVEIGRGWGSRGTRIVLCDAGFEDPTLHRVAGLDNLEGISDALLFGTSFQRLGQPLSDGLFLASAGTAVPDGEALRVHPRWRDFARGFQDAGALLVLFVPAGAPGAEALIGLCDAALVLGTREAASAVELPADVNTFAAVGPAGAVESEPPPGPGSPEALVAEEPESGESSEEEEPVSSAPVDLAVAPEGEGGGGGEGDAPAGEARAPDLEAGQPGDGVADASERVEDPLAQADEPKDHVAGAGDLADPFPVEPIPPDAAAAASAGALELASAAQEVDPEKVESLSEAPDYPLTPTRSRSRGTKKEAGKGIAGRTRTLLVLLAVVVVAVVVAARAGFVEIPGLTPAPEQESSGGEGSVVSASEAPVDQETSVPIGEETPEDPAREPAVEATEDAPATPPPGMAEAASGSSVPQPYFLALGSFEELDLAQRRARVNRRTFPTVDFVVAPVEVNGRPWFRLLAGAAGDPDALGVVRERLTGSPIPSGGSRDWFVRRADLAFLLAEFPTADAAEEEVTRLEGRGVPAYALRYTGPDGGDLFRIYVGAYSDAQEASYMARLLDEAGLQGVRLTERLGVRP